MKRIYTTIKEFNAQHKNVKAIENVLGVNVDKTEYIIDRDTNEIFKLGKVYKEPQKDCYGNRYDIEVVEIETRGKGRNNRGYRVVKLGKKTVPLFKVVAATFIERPAGCTNVLHLDGNPLNDYYKNLRWISHKELVKMYYDGILPQKEEKDDNIEVIEDESSEFSWDDVIFSIPPAELRNFNIDDVIEDYEAGKLSEEEYKQELDRFQDLCTKVEKRIAAKAKNKN